MIKNIIIVNDYDYIQGGASKVAINTANLLARQYNVYFFCSVSDNTQTTLDKSIKIVSCNKFDSLSNPNKILGLLQGIYNRKANVIFKQLLKKLIPNETLVFIHGYTKALSTSWIRYCKKYSVKTMLTGHDYFSFCPNGGIFNYNKNRICNLKPCSIRCVCSNCDSRNYFYKIYRVIRLFFQNKIYKFRKRINYLITISPLNEQLLKPYFKKTIIFELSNPISTIKPVCRIEVEKNNSFLYIGRVCKEKGVIELCEEFYNSNRKLIIVGDGPLLSHLILKYKNSNISFVGWKNSDQMYEYKKNARMLIFPSLWYEASPLTPLEAMADGIPCIISKYTASNSLIKDNNGLLYDPYVKGELLSLINNLTDQDIKIMSERCFDEYWNAPFDDFKYNLDLNNIILKVSKDYDYYS